MAAIDAHRSPNVPAPAATAAAPSAAALEMIDRLIAIPTVSRDSNLGLIELARDHLAALGMKPHLVYDSTEKKANLFCTLADDAAAAKTRGIVLSGHTDVVPVDGQDWTSDPFKAAHRDGRIHGRGTADMKGFIAIALAWAPRFLAAQSRLPVHLSLTFKPAGCIIGEPTDMQAIVAHKGKRDYCCRVRGREAHSSLTPTAVNAIEYAAQVIGFIRALAARMAREEPKDRRFEVPHSTLQTGVIRGGIATNVVPRDCEFFFEMRNIPATQHDAMSAQILEYAGALLPEMRAVAPEADIGFEMGLDLPAFGIAPDAPVVKWAQALARTQHLGTGAVSFATEASVFSGIGIPTVVLGPGSIAQAHKPDEYITYGQVAACEQFFERLAEATPPAG
jgi:acetylornithine deacetylase